MSANRTRISALAVMSVVLTFGALPAHAEAEFGLMNNPDLSPAPSAAPAKPQTEMAARGHRGRHARQQATSARFASLEKTAPEAKPIDDRSAEPASSSSSSSIRPAIVRHAAAQGVPAALADAVIKVESRYNPRAYNSGNYGLMQIRLQTARGLGYTGGAAGLLNAETNMRFGMKYLAQAYRMSGGDICRTVMRYQSGHYATSMNSANRAYCSKVRAYMREV